MNAILQEFLELNIWRDVQSSSVQNLMSTAEIKEFSKGDIITQQFSPTSHFYLLHEGTVEFSIMLEEMQQPLVVGTSSELWSPMGWSGFRSPYRYATTVTALESTKVVTWKHSDLRKAFDDDAILGMEFILFVADRSNDLLNQVRTLIAKTSKTDWLHDDDSIDDAFLESQKRQDPDLSELLRKSPFFEVFKEKTINHLEDIAVQRKVARGDVIREQGSPYDTFLMMGYGKLAYRFRSADDEENPISVRSLSSSGYVVSWQGAASEVLQDTTIVALRDSILYEWKRESLLEYVRKNPTFGLGFAYRVLWLTGNYLRAARALLISRRFEKEIVSISNLIEQNCTMLSVKSPLHKVPHLLSHTYTLGDAFGCLNEVLESGTSVERGVAQLSLDILGEVKREQVFFSGLQKVYHKVVTADSELEPKDIRKICAKQFVKVFDKVPHIISGWENLPESSGHIFIYNHLENHKFNTLPNNFQLTLDSHFMSSMILYRKYHDPGIRVVRIGRGIEYGHQDYYGRLGHLDVFTADSDATQNTKEAREAQRQLFFQEASNYLTQGVNLMLSPEGASFTTEDSPGQLKSGAFRVAAMSDKNPLIVPIAVANFDKRVHRNTFSVVIKKPFRINDVVSDPNDRNQLESWLKGYQATYRNYVEEAIDQARPKMDQ